MFIFYFCSYFRISQAVKYAYYGRELMNVIINDDVLSALGTYTHNIVLTMFIRVLNVVVLIIS